jgi:Fe-S cluster assembly protein SufD
MTAVLEKSGRYEEHFASVEKTLPGAQLPWLSKARQEGLKRFAELGFPTQKNEAWRFTSVDVLAKGAFEFPGAGTGAVGQASVAEFSFRGLESFQLVFVNGRYAPDLSTVPSDANVRVGDLTSFLLSNAQDLERHLARYASNDQPFTALNTALFAGGAHVYLPRNTQLDTPIHLLFITSPEHGPIQTHPRVLIVADEGAKAVVIENHAGPQGAAYWTNVVTEVVLGENAQLDHYKVQRESKQAYHISTIEVRQARGSRYRSHAALLGAALSRNNIQVRLEAEGAECSLDGLYLVGGKQLSDTHTLVDHIRPHGTSREYYKGILDEKAQGVFEGHVIVRKEAQKTDSSQTNKNLLLSNEAKVNTKPELKIFANDVKCKHGATIGQISAEQLFYLRSRGISKEAARNLLIYAFASELIEQIEIPALKEGLSGVIFRDFGPQSHV